MSDSSFHFNSPLGSSVYSRTTPMIPTTSPPAIVQSAEQKSFVYWKAKIAKLAIEVTTKAKEYREAVKEFKEGGSWKTEFKTWGECCEKVLGITRQRANELIRELTENLADNDKQLNPTEAERGVSADHDTRIELSGGKKSEPLSVHLTSTTEKSPSKLEKNGAPEGKKAITADEWEKREKYSAPEPKVDKPKGPPMDETGEFIPQRCLDAWSKRDEVQPWMTMASQLKCFIQGLGQSPNGNYRPLSGQTISLQKSATEIFRWLELCKPHAVCYACHGTGSFNRDQCPVCYAVGLISRNTWNDDWGIVGMGSKKEAEVERRATRKA